MDSLREKGSVTVFLALLLSLLVALVASCLSSVQMACARAQIAQAADIGLYSLFAQYDTSLLEEFHLFYLDGGYGQGELQMSKAYDTVVEYTDPVLQQNYQNLNLKSGGITGYSLATDQRGSSFCRQAVAYMKETLGEQGIQLLIQKIQSGSENVQEQQATKEQAQIGNRLEDYDQAVAEAAQQQPPEGEGGGEVEELPGGVEEVPVPQEPIENPIDTIRQIQNMGILDLVLTNPAEISDKAVDLSSLASHRTLQKGMGEMSAANEGLSVSDRVLFQEYILQVSGNYRNPVTSGKLAYPLEYIIGKQSSDIENLKSVANRLLMIREGVNFAHLLTDPQKRAAAASLAAAIAAALMIPLAEGIVEMVLLACWAYGESILDVRELFDGGKVALVKNAVNWQLSLENLPKLLEGLDTQRRNEDQGMSYEDYLRVLLYLESEDTQIMKCMDVFELTVRGTAGHENFRMDSCIDAMSVAFDVEANRKKTYQVSRQYGYCM